MIDETKTDYHQADRPNDFTRMALVENAVNKMESELKELLARRTPWFQIIALGLPVLFSSLGFGFQNSLQLQIISERQVQFQRLSDAAQTEYKRQLDNLANQDTKLDTRLKDVERDIDRLKR
jgi:hypothetical protein